MESFLDLRSFLNASPSIEEAEIDFEWSQIETKKTDLARFKKLSLLSFGPKSKLIKCDFVENFPNLKIVWAIGQHRLIDISALTAIPDLEEFKVTAAWQLDLSPFDGLSNLKKLTIDGPTKKYKCLNSLKNLVCLDMSNLKLKDLKSISALSSLRVLRARAIPLRTFGEINPNAPIEHLDLSQTKIKNLDSIHPFSNLKELRIADCKMMEDISAVTRLKSLKQLYLNNIPNELDISPLSDCPELEVLFFYGTKVSQNSLQVLNRIPKLRKCEFNLDMCPNWTVNEVQSLSRKCMFRLILKGGNVYKSLEEQTNTY
jgi:hypothetical protein